MRDAREVNRELLDIVLWALEEGREPRPGQPEPLPLLSTKQREHALNHYMPQRTLHIIEADRREAKLEVLAELEQICADRASEAIAERGTLTNPAMVKMLIAGDNVAINDEWLRGRNNEAVYISGAITALRSELEKATPSGEPSSERKP
jgi:hypothetical protein